MELISAETQVEPAQPSTAIDGGRGTLDAATRARPDSALAPDAVGAPSPCVGAMTDCDGETSNGCETDVDADPLHCGGCNQPCTNEHGSTACSAGECVPSCNLDFADCDGDPRNGCEASLDTASNCGACGNECAASDGRPLCTASGCGTTCDFTGTWAVQVDFETSWPAASVIVAGRGHVRYWQRFELARSRGGVSGSATACGTVIPDTRTDLGGGESFGVWHPDTLYDVVPPLFTPVAVALTLSGDVPGSTFTLPAFALPRGIKLDDPLADAWPAAPLLVVQVDDDKDGQVGFTVPFKTGMGLAYPALDLLRTLRSDRAYVADRLIYGALGSMVSCVRASGSANVVAFDSTIMGCQVYGLGPCLAPQRDLLDGNAPRFAPGSGSVSMVRVPDGAGCAEVRAALP